VKLRRPIHKQLSDARRGSRLDCLPRCFNCFSISLVHSTVECTRLIETIERYGSCVDCIQG